MSRERNMKRRRTSAWLVVGVIIAVILLVLWLTIADLWGDTDVNAIMPAVF